MDRNTLIAVLLSFILVFIVLTFFSPKVDKGKEGRGEQTKEAQKRENDSPVNKQDNLARAADGGKIEQGQSTFKKENPNSRSLVSKRIMPSNAFDPSNSLGRAKINKFELENNVIRINFTTLDAAVTSIKLKDYKDENGNLIDAVFHKDNTRISPLATSFVGARHLDAKLKAAYQYGIYSYNGKEKKLTVSDTGTLLDKHLDYFEIVKDNLGRAITNNKDYEGSYNIALFSARYSIAEGDKKKEIEFVKMYILGEKEYTFNLDFKIINRSDEAVIIGNNEDNNQNASFYIHWGDSLGPFYTEAKKSQYDELIQSAYLEELDDLSTEEHIVDTGRIGFGNFKWISLDSRYLMLSIIPDWNNVKGSGGDNIRKWNKGGYFGEIYGGETKEVSSFVFWKDRVRVNKNREVIGVGFHKIYLTKLNDSKDFHLTIFVGPKTRSLLTKDAYSNFELIKVRDRSWVPFIKPLEWAMEWLLFTSYDYIVPNFGVAIVILTIILKILLHPLTRKSLTATKKMSELQPKIKELEAKFKNNSQKKQKELMALYKKEGINPLGGCLPLVFQLPVFFALWNVIPYLIELKSSTFLWIKDLSSPDTVAHLPLILTNDLNILPIIMTLTSVVQMKFTPQATPGMGMGGDNKAQTAKMMQYTMPLVFLFIFWSMPSGLVLYWTVQNILQIAQQLYTNMSSKSKKKK